MPSDRNLPEKSPAINYPNTPLERAFLVVSHLGPLTTEEITVGDFTIPLGAAKFKVWNDLDAYTYAWAVSPGFINFVADDATLAEMANRFSLSDQKESLWFKLHRQRQITALKAQQKWHKFQLTKLEAQLEKIKST